MGVRRGGGQEGALGPPPTLPGKIVSFLTFSKENSIFEGI